MAVQLHLRRKAQDFGIGRIPRCICCIGKEAAPTGQKSVGAGGGSHDQEAEPATSTCRIGTLAGCDATPAFVSHEAERKGFIGRSRESFPEQKVCPGEDSIACSNTPKSLRSTNQGGDTRTSIPDWSTTIWGAEGFSGALQEPSRAYGVKKCVSWDSKSHFYCVFRDRMLSLKCSPEYTGVQCPSTSRLALPSSLIASCPTFRRRARCCARGRRRGGSTRSVPRSG